MKRNMLSCALCLFLVLVLQSFVSNTMALGILGTVVDNGNKPLEFVNLELLSANDSTFIQGTVSGKSGFFSLAVTENKTYIIKASFVGYKTIYKNCRAGDIGKITLLPNETLLNEAVIISKLPRYEMKNGGLITNVHNSVLSLVGTASDLLKYIPGIIGQNGEFTVYGKGTPLIFIDQREVHDVSELNRLNSSVIKKVEVITNPGARYDASIKAVIRITTIQNTNDGFGIDLSSVAAQSQNLDLTEQLNANYRHKNLNIFYTSQYGHKNLETNRNIEQSVYADTLWTQKNSLVEQTRIINFKNDLDLNYIINEKHTIGIRYSITTSLPDQTNQYSVSNIQANDMYYDYLQSNSQSLTNRKPLQQVNVYYSGKIKDFTVDLNADVLWNKTETNSDVKEYSKEEQSRDVLSVNRIKNRLYAGKLVLGYALMGGVFSFGSEYVFTNRNDEFQSSQDILPATDGCIEEHKSGSFFEYGKLIKVANLKLGLRFEHVQSAYYESERKVNDQSNTYDRFFPDLSLATQIGKTQLQLSYTSKIKRPTYYQLRSNMNYMSRYTYQNGNPLLKPEVINDVTLSGDCNKFIQFMMSYQHEKNAIVYVAEQYEKNPAITLVTHKNFSGINNFSVFITASPKIKLWQSQISTGIRKQWAMVNNNGYSMRLNTPMCFLSLNNSITFSKNTVLRLDFNYQSRGDYQNVSLTNSQFVISAGFYKSFFNDKLSFNLQGMDLTRGQCDGNVLYNNKMNMRVYNKYDTREVRLTIRYKLNSTNSKLKKTNLSFDEINRL